jgi:hypothetical protein
MSLEHDLRRALTRRDPPAGFDERVLLRIAAGETVHMRAPVQRWRRAALPLAASLMVAFGATYYMQQHQRQARETQAHTEQAARQVVLALQIASSTVAAAQAKLEEMTRYEPTNDY